MKKKNAKKADHYETLGVPRNAGGETIKRAYRRRAMENHPDKGGSNEEFLAVQRAFDTLGDEAARERYDRTGRDAHDIPPEGKARQILCELMVAIVERVGESNRVDVLEVIREQVRETMKEHRELAVKLRKKAAHFTAAAKRVMVMEGENCLSIALENAAAGAEQSAMSIDGQVDIGKAILQEAAAFEYRVDKPPSHGFNNQETLWGGVEANRAGKRSRQRI